MRTIIVIGLVTLLLSLTASPAMGGEAPQEEAVPLWPEGQPQRWRRMRDETVRARFALAIERCEQLAAKEEPPETPEMQQAVERDHLCPEGSLGGDSPKRFPRQSHVAEYERLRPWAWYYKRWAGRHGAETVPVSWPKADQAPILRRLLEDEEPAIRALAIEALATIHEPQDVPRLARFLADEGQAAPYLEHYWSMSSWSAISLLGAGLAGDNRVSPEADSLELYRAWRRDSVSQYAQRALRLMTGQRFTDQREFHEWWELNGDARNRLWYWEQRLARERGEAEVSVSQARIPPRPDETYEQYRARQAALERAAVAHVCETIAAELRQLDPEVEAKVLLLITHCGGSVGSRHEIPFWSQPPDVRLPRERLLDMLDRKDLCREETELYPRLVNRLGRWAPELFEPKDVPRLKAVLEREEKAIGKAPLVIGISRLLPPAKLTEMDSPETREGFLREWIQKEEMAYSRGTVVAELARVGVAGSEVFLTDLAFAVPDQRSHRSVLDDILRGLGEPPLTDAKKAFLVELLLDSRFEEHWRQPDWGRHAKYAADSLNAHAGETLIDRMLLQSLRDPEQAEEAMEEVQAILRGQLAVEASQD
jgi:HEAT repeats